MHTPRFHIIVDLQRVEIERLNNSETLSTFLQTLSKTIDMNILFGPIVKEGIPENPGLTGFVIIDYSHISIHTFTKTQEAFVDIFSCKTYEQAKALQAVIDYFGVEKDSANIQEVQWGNK
jgi:S-adenosylmethionine decarboxylase